MVVPYVPECGLHAVLWSHIGTLMHLPAAEPRIISWLLFPSVCLCGTILLTLYSMVWDWRVLIAEPMLAYFLSSTVFHISSFFPWVNNWYCGAEFFRLIWCKSLSPSLKCRHFLIINNNNYKYHVKTQLNVYVIFSVTPVNCYAGACACGC